MDTIVIIGNATKEILNRLYTNAQVEVQKKDRQESDDRDSYHISIQGDDLGLLIGYKGENLDALEYILAQIVNRQLTERVRVLVDIGGWRQERYAQIEKIIDQSISRLQDLELDETLLPPMRPHERRKAHELISQKGYLSESHGMEPNRKIKIKKM